MNNTDSAIVKNYQQQPIVLSAKNVSKAFRLPTEQATGLKQAFINWTRGIKGYRQQQVLEDISFEVHQGEFFGIVGRNGGGKSTLLKLISQIYYPDSGSINVQGKLVPFIELGVGFNPELTGRENVYLNGALLGFSTEEIDAMYDDIVSFAELDEFMDQKLKNYSSGMQVRLAFSVAIKAQGDILVLDEVLAVGDEAFQRKCSDFFEEIKKDSTKTVILVTHDMSSVKKYCTRAMMISEGNITAIGDPETVAQQYTLANIAAEKELENKRRLERKDFANGLNERCPILRTFTDEDKIYKRSESIKFHVEYDYSEDKVFYLAIALHDIRRGGITYDTGSRRLKMLKKGHHIVDFELPLHLFNDGEFRFIASLWCADAETPKDVSLVAVALEENALTFVIRDPSGKNSYALLNDDAITIKPTGSGVEMLPR